MSAPRETSRLITGFHRLGLVLAVPFLLGAIGTAISGWFSDDGPYVPDPNAIVPMQIILKAQTPFEQAMEALRRADAAGNVEDARRHAKIAKRLKPTNDPDAPWDNDPELVGTYELEMGPVRTFNLYQYPQVQQKGESVDGESEVADPSNEIFTSIVKFERRRGSVLLAEEQPILVGGILVQEDIAARNPWGGSQRSWTHLARGFDWDRIEIAGLLAAFAAFLYIVARALGWVIDGFVSRTA